MTRHSTSHLLIAALSVTTAVMTIVAVRASDARVTNIVQRARALPVTMSAPLAELSQIVTSDAEVLDLDVAFYQQRVNADRRGALDRVALATTLSTRSRATGSTSDMSRAESLARESIAISERRNGRAFELLASTLMSRHAFRDAHAVAARIDSLEPNTPSHLALLGEIELELGAYDSAAAHFRAVRYDGRQFTVGARLARWYEVSGRADIARDLMKRSIIGVDKRDDLPREQAAWFHYRLGELELRTGRLNAAQDAFEHALARNDGDIRALGGLARVAVARGEWRDAIGYGELATGVQLDPTTLGTLAQAYAALGDTAQSTRYASAMSISALTQPGSIHRAWGLHLLDHGTAAERAEVLRRARDEIRERGDVYGHDLLAWALFRAGQLNEAQREMRVAQSQRTEDMQLTAHARAIDSAIASR